jgi:hypothetical protein
VEVNLKTLCGSEAVFVVMLLGDFEVGRGKSCFGVMGLGQFHYHSAILWYVSAVFVGETGGEFNVNY